MSRVRMCTASVAIYVLMHVRPCTNMDRLQAFLEVYWRIQDCSLHEQLCKDLVYHPWQIYGL
jgi:hypothetical protein